MRQILRIIDEIRPEKFVLAHMGNWGLWEDVERDLAGAPVWFDTAFAIAVILLLLTLVINLSAKAAAGGLAKKRG